MTKHDVKGLDLVFSLFLPNFNCNILKCEEKLHQGCRTMEHFLVKMPLLWLTHFTSFNQASLKYCLALCYVRWSIQCKIRFLSWKMQEVRWEPITILIQNKTNSGSFAAKGKTLKIQQQKSVKSLWKCPCLPGNIYSRYLWSSFHPTGEIFTFYFTNFCIPWSIY